MLKKILLTICLIVVVVVSGMAYWGYSLSKIDREKCGHLGSGYTYREGSGCVLKSAIAGEQEYINNLKQEGTYDEAVEKSRVEARDIKRITSLKDLTARLTEYKSRNGEYPIALKDLLSLDPDYTLFLNDPDDKQVPYHYATKKNSNNKIIEYHLGASLETTERDETYLAEDSDYNSIGSGWLNGFNGNDQEKCSPEDTGKFCYDIKNL